MISKKTGNSIKARLLIAVLSVALVFTMMPLTMGNSYAEDEPVVTDEQAAEVGEEAVDADEPADVDSVIEKEKTVVEPETDALKAKSESDVLSAKGATSVVITGDVLKEEKTISVSDVASILAPEEVTFTGVNQKYGNVGTATVTKGVYIEPLINYVGLKEGAKVKGFLVTSEKNGEVTTDEFNYEWLMELPDAEADDSFKNGKAMLAFEYKEENKNGVLETKTDVRLFLGCFSKGMPNSPADATAPALANHIANKPLWKEGILKIEVEGVLPGEVTSSAGSTYAVTSATDKTVALTKAKNTKKVTVPDTVVYKDETYKVTKVNANAFTGKKIRTVTLGTNIDTIAKFAFKKSKARTLIVKTKALTKKSVKGSLKKSKIKRVKVKVGSKKENKKYVKKYRKIFKKKNSGKRVKVRR